MNGTRRPPTGSGGREVVHPERDAVHPRPRLALHQRSSASISVRLRSRALHHPLRAERVDARRRQAEVAQHLTRMLAERARSLRESLRSGWPCVLDRCSTW
jgi:hypothetical protein